MADIEQLGTSEVIKLISKTDFMKAFINSNSNEPFFDGTIQVYANANKEQGAYQGRIPVQVKSEIVDNLNVPEAKYSITKEVTDHGDGLRQGIDHVYKRIKNLSKIQFVYPGQHAYDKS